MPSDADAVWLYGSYSRGDSDGLSDIDVLLITDGQNLRPTYDALEDAASDVSVSCYVWDEIEMMAEYGSLFLHHLKLEGRPIAEGQRCQGRLRKILDGLGPYQLARRDLIGFRQVLNDVVESLSDGHASLQYELSTLGTVFRHASILSCALEGTFCFSRSGPVERVVVLTGLPKTWALEFRDLYDYRLFTDGRLTECEEPSVEVARTWCSRTGVLLDVLGRRIHD